MSIECLIVVENLLYIQEQCRKKVLGVLEGNLWRHKNLNYPTNKWMCSCKTPFCQSNLIVCNLWGSCTPKCTHITVPVYNIHHKFNLVTISYPLWYLMQSQDSIPWQASKKQKIKITFKASKIRLQAHVELLDRSLLLIITTPQPAP